MESKWSLPFRLTFSYMGGLLWLGWRRPLEKGDLSDMLEAEDGSIGCAARLQAHLDRRTPLFTSLVLLSLEDMCAAGVGKLLGDLLGFIQPLSINGILLFVALRAAGQSDVLWGLPSAQLQMGYWWLLAAVFSGVLQNLCLHRHHHHSIRAGMHIRSALTHQVFQKALRLTPKERLRFGSGKVQNLGSTDPNTVGMLFWFLHYAWAAPLQLALCMAMLYANLGVSSFVGLAILVALIPVQGTIGSALTALSKATLVHSDARIKL